MCERCTTRGLDATRKIQVLKTCPTLLLLTQSRRVSRKRSQSAKFQQRFRRGRQILA